MTTTPPAAPQPGDAERLTPHVEAHRLHATVRYTHDYNQILINLISERNARDAEITRLRADRDNSNTLLDECRHERNVLQRICAERASQIEQLGGIVGGPQPKAGGEDVERARKIVYGHRHNSDDTIAAVAAALTATRHTGAEAMRERAESTAREYATNPRDEGGIADVIADAIAVLPTDTKDDSK